MRLTLLLPVLLTLCLLPLWVSAKEHKKSEPSAKQCLAFSPYVGELNPNWAHPSRELIDALFDKVLKETPFRCIMTYGVLNGLDYAIKAAEARKMQVISILWLDDDPKVNSQSISRGIALAREFPDTIKKISCGSEVRTRHGTKLDSEIIRCLNALREAKIPQPVTTIDTWWEWCDRSSPCRPTGFEASVDWIGINVFPWWENIHAGKHSCIPADKAADFHLARMEEVRRAYPGKEVVLTEFGWPSGPEGVAAVNKHTGEKCGIAGEKNQKLVLESTLKALRKRNWSGNVFEAFSENWKPADEGDAGRYWGICAGQPPYSCKNFPAGKF